MSFWGVLLVVVGYDFIGRLMDYINERRTLCNKHQGKP